MELHIQTKEYGELIKLFCDESYVDNGLNFKTTSQFNCLSYLKNKKKRFEVFSHCKRGNMGNLGLFD